MARQIKFIPPLQVSVTGSIPVTVNSIKPVKDPVIYNVDTDPTPNTETSVSLSTLKSFIVLNKGSTVVKLSFLSGASGTIYISIPPGNYHSADNIDDQNITIYVQSSSPSQRLEIVTWS